MSENEKSLGQVAYEHYAHLQNPGYPAWKQLTIGERQEWNFVASKVILVHKEREEKEKLPNGGPIKANDNSPSEHNWFWKNPLPPGKAVPLFRERTDADKIVEAFSHCIDTNFDEDEKKSMGLVSLNFVNNNDDDDEYDISVRVCTYVSDDEDSEEE